MDFHDLEIWKMGMKITKDVYQYTSNFPKSEIYGLTSQMRRAAVSIPSNIAEGNGRCYQKEYIQFLHISQGSLLELMTQLELSKDLKFLSEKDFTLIIDKCTQLNKMLRSLIKNLKNRV
ncbi:MAG TPA: four helix bundle protein [Thermotogota bacterium]|nr:four helix bundle protein [Thermotogota bacterium]